MTEHKNQIHISCKNAYKAIGRRRKKDEKFICSEVVGITGVLEDLMCLRMLVKSSSLVALLSLARRLIGKSIPVPSNPFFALSCSGAGV